MVTNVYDEGRTERSSVALLVADIESPRQHLELIYWHVSTRTAVCSWLQRARHCAQFVSAKPPQPVYGQHHVTVQLRWRTEVSVHTAPPPPTPILIPLPSYWATLCCPQWSAEVNMPWTGASLQWALCHKCNVLLMFSFYTFVLCGCEALWHGHI